MRALRERAFEYFAANGFPTPRLEDWKYTNVAEIAKREWTVGRYGFSLSELDDDARAIVERFKFDRNGLTALNMAFAEFAVVRIPKDTVTKADRFDLSAPAGRAVSACDRHRRGGCKATLVGVYESEGATSPMRRAVVVEGQREPDAYRVQKESPRRITTA